MSQPARPSLGWDTVGERYGHLYVENFRQLTALPKYTSISIKICLRILGCMNWKTAYSLKQFLPPIPKKATFKTATTRLFTSLCFSLCTCLIVTSCVFPAREQLVNVTIIWNKCILLLQWIIDTGIYVHGTENNILRLNFHNAFHNVFLIILLLDYKEFEFAWCVFKK